MTQPTYATSRPAPRPRRRPSARRPTTTASHTPAPFEPIAHDPTPMEFASFGLDARLQTGVNDRGFIRTTPIQSAVYPTAHSGADLVACAETGTGKTAAYLLPILQRLLTADDAGTERRSGTRVLILAPTRELAAQIEDDLQGFAYHTSLSSVAVYGGVGADLQARALRAGVDIVVATPGRLIDHLNTGITRFDTLEVLVLDEADRMLDMGFWPDVRRIVAALPAERQTLLFSATTSEDVTRSASQIMRAPKLVQIGRVGGLATTITHVGHTLSSDQKTPWLTSFLRRTEGPTIVFVRTKRWADRLARRLAAGNIRCTALHADRTQSQRTEAIEGFRSGRFHVLVATDLAARGLDIDRIGHVVNYEVPPTADAYVHRVGRTGRADAAGTAVTLVAPEELPVLRAIERSLNLRMVQGSGASSPSRQMD